MGPYPSCLQAAKIVSIVLPGSLQAVYWAKLAQAHLRSNDVASAKQVFSRSMLNCLSMDVWMTYMQFIKQVWCPCTLHCCASLASVCRKSSGPPCPVQCTVCTESSRLCTETASNDLEAARGC